MSGIREHQHNESQGVITSNLGFPTGKGAFLGEHWAVTTLSCLRHWPTSCHTFCTWKRHLGHSMVNLKETQAHISRHYVLSQCICHFWFKSVLCSCPKLYTQVTMLSIFFLMSKNITSFMTSSIVPTALMHMFWGCQTSLQFRAVVFNNGIRTETPLHSHVTQ